MSVKPPTSDAAGRLYTIAEASKSWHVPAGVLYGEIKAGRLRAKVRRGNTRGYLVTASIMDDWIGGCLVDASEAVRGAAS